MRFISITRNSDAVRLAALDRVEANVMVTDEKYNIIYVNRAMLVFLSKAEPHLKKAFPGFSTATLVGRSIEIFQNDLGRSLLMLDGRSARSTASFDAGGRIFELRARPIVDERGRRSGAVVVWRDATENTNDLDKGRQFAAISKAHLILEFKTDGTLITANRNFLAEMDYSLGEVVGRHHDTFLFKERYESDATKTSWRKLAKDSRAAVEVQFARKDGADVWLQASYNAILDEKGEAYKVVVFATEVTAQRRLDADHALQIAAISKSQAVVAFDLGGIVIAANGNYLKTMGFRDESEIVGLPHSTLVTPAERASRAYSAFWERLLRGEYDAGEYLRIGKDGREVWLQASYNPIRDLNGKTVKVVTYAVDVTRQVVARKRSEYINGALSDVACGARELNASVAQIVDAMGKSKQTAEIAFGKVEEADMIASRLSKVAQSMGGIVAMIGGLTGQINLLALNATIEAARAGEAGRGFAVVASEVKTLANQARKATDQISEEIEEMRKVSCDVVGSLATIKASLEQVREYVTSTTASIEEESSVAGEMSHRMQQVATEASQLGR